MVVVVIGPDFFASFSQSQSATSNQSSASLAASPSAATSTIGSQKMQPQTSLSNSLNAYATNDITQLLKHAQALKITPSPKKTTPAAAKKTTFKTQTITKISAQKRSGRYNIFLNDNFFMGVSERVIVKLRLHKGQALTEADISTIKEAETNASAYKMALDYLSYSMRTTREVRQKLAQNGVLSSVIDQVIAQLDAQHLLDDLAYAKSFVRTQQKTSDKGPKNIIAALRQKGIGEALIDEALAQYDDESQEQKAAKLATKYYSRYQNDAYLVQQQKVIKQLLAKGFDITTAKTVAAKMQPKNDPDEELAKLTHAMNKTIRRYRRYDERTAKNKLINALLRKGFNYSDINNWLDDNPDFISEECN